MFGSSGLPFDGVSTLAGRVKACTVSAPQLIVMAVAHIIGGGYGGEIKCSMIYFCKFRPTGTLKAELL